MINSIMLQSGGLFDFDDPYSSFFTIKDIAHNLSHLCRFNGACDYFYSVAQHSVGVSYLVPRELAKAALVHDAAEAFYGDMTTWLKSKCPDYRALLEVGEDAVAERLGVPQGMHPLIKRADHLMLAVERRALFSKSPLSDDGFHHIKDLDEADITVAADKVCVIPSAPGWDYWKFLDRWKEVA